MVIDYVKALEFTKSISENVMVENRLVLLQLASARDDKRDADLRCWQRTATRVIFGEVEASLFSFRQFAIPMLMEFNDTRRGPLSLVDRTTYDELMTATNEVEIVVGENGLPQEKERKISLTAYLKAIVRLTCFALRIPRSKANEILSGASWDKVRKAIKVRDRFTHPKSNDDLVVTDDKFDLVHHFYRWFYETFLPIRDEFDAIIKRSSSGQLA